MTTHTKRRKLKLKPRFEEKDSSSFFDGYDVVDGSIAMDDPDKVYELTETLPGDCPPMSRAEFREAWRQAFHLETVGIFHAGFRDLLERQLFGKGE